MSAADSSRTSTRWNRRSSAGSPHTQRTYSSSVVAPITRKSPRTSAGLSMLPASIAAPIAAALADQVVQFVDEEDDVADAGDRRPRAP